MKAFLRSLLVTAMLVPAAVLAASFEGKVSFTISSGKDKAQSLTYVMKGDKLRMEIPSEKGTGGMIMDLGKREMTMIMDDQRMYMVMPMSESAMQKVEKQGEDVTLEKTGETEKILGYTATKYISTYENTKTDLWLAEGLGTFMSPAQGQRGGRRGAAPQAWERALAGKELFPLRVVGHDKSGKENFRMDVTAIDKAPQPDSLFTPPAGYQKFDMPGMGGMLKGLLPGR